MPLPLRITRNNQSGLKWITFLMIFYGCRPSEVYQLNVRDINLDSEQPTIKFTNLGSSQRLNATGYRAGERATAYSFRHTFIDMLKNM
ncbi:hypothetical protein [Vibrio halioticoli]|uniref:hypothetical protein n=1 Tax=Vibrio halioticoli TaxID=71388 RepID=UPI0012EB5E67|nr:hypothetical protein [Vibrio halioticoli]